MSLPFGNRPCMHEVLFDDHWLEGTGVTTLDFAKAMIDEGFHPMTVYFPLVVHGAMLIEPTESESKQSLDQFIARCAVWPRQPRRGEPSASRMRRALPRVAGSTRPGPRGSRRLRWQPAAAHKGGGGIRRPGLGAAGAISGE